MLGRKIKIFFFLQICQAEFIIISKNNQGSCLGCLGGNDAPEYTEVVVLMDQIEVEFRLI